MIMVIIDIVIVLVVLFGGVLGYRDGLFRKILAMTSFFIGIIVATEFMGIWGRVLYEIFGFSREICYMLAFFSIFTVIVVLQNFLYYMVGEIGGLGRVVNRLGGILIGLFQGSLAISLVLLLLSVFEIPPASVKGESSLYKPFLNVAPRVFDFASVFLPESKSFYGELKKYLAKYKVFT